MARRTWLVLVLVMAASGCGDDDGGGTTDAGRDGATVPPAPTPPGTPPTPPGTPPPPPGTPPPPPGTPPPPVPPTPPGTPPPPVPPTPPGTPPPPPTACDAAPMRTGEATYYDADGSGACGFAPSPGDLMVAAMNAPDFGGSGVCGSCAHVVGPEGEITVRIVDLCPECPTGNLDLSPQAFERIAPLPRGRVPIEWREVPCEVTGPLVYHFKDGSNQWWTALQIRNHRHAIARFEYLADDGSFREVERLDYNYFVEDMGMGPGPYTFRVTDVHGHVVEDSGIPARDDDDVPSASQLALCE